MKVNDFAVLVCEHEGKKKEVNIAQVKEILKVINVLLDKQLYPMIKSWDEGLIEMEYEDDSID